MKQLKNLFISIIVFDIVSFIPAVVATAFAFKDYSTERYSYYNGSYYSSYYDYYDHPETGIMPFFGLLFLIGAVVLLLLSHKKRNTLFSMLSFFSYMPAILLFSLAIAEWHEMSFSWFIVLWCCAGLLFVSMVLTIAYWALNRSLCKIVEEQKIPINRK